MSKLPGLRSIRRAIWPPLRLLALYVLIPWLTLIGLFAAGVTIWSIYIRMPAPIEALEALQLPTEQAHRSGLFSGSGFFISDDGLVVTARHVVDGCAMLAARDEEGRFYPLAVVDTHQTHDVALLQAIGARAHPYLALPTGALTIPGEAWMSFTGAPGRPSLFESMPPMRSFAFQYLVEAHSPDDGHTFLAPYDWRTRGSLQGASGGPLTLNDNRVVGVTVQAQPPSPGNRLPKSWPAHSPFVVFEPIDVAKNMLTPTQWARISDSAASLRGVPIEAVVRIWCRAIDASAKAHS